jgi:hypothetical protein
MLYIKNSKKICESFPLYTKNVYICYMAKSFHPKDPKCKEILNISQQEALKLCKHEMHIGFDAIIKAICEMKGRHQISLNQLKILLDVYNGNEDIDFALYEDNGRFNVELIYEKFEDHRFIYGATDNGLLVCYRYNGKKVTFYNLKSSDVAELAAIKNVRGSLGHIIEKNEWFYTEESEYNLLLRNNQSKSNEAVKKYDL